ncbi:hypothetical protein GCM10027174_35950 [Salinifilum aidingensis]
MLNAITNSEAAGGGTAHRLAERQQRLEHELDAPVNQLSTGDGTLLHHPGPFPDASRTRERCRQHGLPDPAMCRPRYLGDEG